MANEPRLPLADPAQAKYAAALSDLYYAVTGTEPDLVVTGRIEAGVRAYFTLGETDSGFTKGLAAIVLTQLPHSLKGVKLNDHAARMLGDFVRYYFGDAPALQDYFNASKGKP